MRPRLHECAVPHCDRQIPRHLLMCMDHWRMVPAPLRRDVTAAWRHAASLAKHQGRPDMHAQRAHRHLAEQAVAAVTGKTEEKQARHAAAGDLFEHNKETHGNTTTSRRTEE